MALNRRAGQRVRAEGPIRFRTSFRNTIYDVLKRRGWKETDAELDWDFHWADREWVYEMFDSIHLEPWQRINHYRNGRELCRKDNLIKNVKRQRKQLEREGRTEEAAAYDFCPTTFVVPAEYALFVEEFKKYANQNKWWIMKPIGKAQGKGIFLFTKLNQIADWRNDYRWKPDNPQVESYVVQEYIYNPYLVGGKKFDMRLYALVTSFQPLVVYQYRAGFARFSSTRYDPTDFSNTVVHLTNVAVQKNADTYNEETGGKWDLRHLKLFLISRHGQARTDALFQEITQIMLKALFSVAKIIINDKHCFELYGYDIMFDENLKPWLLEVNASPSLSANTYDDYDLKFKMLNDMLDIIDVEGRTTGSETRMGGFEMIWNDGPVVPDHKSVHTTILGTDFDKHLNTFKPKPKPADGGDDEEKKAGGSSSSGAAAAGGSSASVATGAGSGSAVGAPTSATPTGSVVGSSGPSPAGGGPATNAPGAAKRPTRSSSTSNNVAATDGRKRPDVDSESKMSGSAPPTVGSSASNGGGTSPSTSRPTSSGRDAPSDADSSRSARRPRVPGGPA